MANFYITRDSGSQIDIESQWRCKVLHSPTFVEQPKDPFVRSWADEDGDDVISNPHTKSQVLDIKVFFEGDGYLTNMYDFCTFMALEDFEWRDTNQETYFNAKYLSVKVGDNDRFDTQKKIIVTITIKNKTGRYERI